MKRWMMILVCAGLATTAAPRITTAADPGLSADAPYSSDAPMLPKSLMAAIEALRDNTCFRAAFGEPFIDYFIKLKEFEIGRFLSDVTDWEQREYFEIL